MNATATAVWGATGGGNPVPIELASRALPGRTVLLVDASASTTRPADGTTLFVGCAIGKVSIEKVSKTLWPFWLTMLVVLLLVTYVPALTLWIPSLQYPGIKF